MSTSCGKHVAGPDILFNGRKINKIYYKFKKAIKSSDEDENYTLKLRLIQNEIIVKPSVSIYMFFI